MKLDLRTLSKTAKLKGVPVLVRVDWNVPMSGSLEREDSLKIERSIPFLQELKKRGAIVIVLTHLGRPTKRDKKYSTKPLATLIKRRHGLHLEHHEESISDKTQYAWLKKFLSQADPGSLHLLENVRFEKGEETNDKALAKAYADLADVFINDAFASCHRAHVSVVGIAKLLPAYAGPSLMDEVSHLIKLIDKPASPFVAVIGGLKLSTKLPVIEALASACDNVMIGGAMSTPFFKAKKFEVGKSVYEKEGVAIATKLLKKKNILLPEDVVVTQKLGSGLRRVGVRQVEKRDMIVDVGPKTLKAWGAHIQSAKTILWNGPLGVTEHASTGFGSRFIARVIAMRAKGKAYGVAGGGDTIPVIVATKTEGSFDFVSTGGGAMLEFIAKRGKLPGIMALLR
ncbi:MAG TPA: phosphoglycerate kinase [Verrucomicrobiae bacterium]|nr:phosphoglycerate kinase [Verrucomicrobiae bacterium]